MARIFKPNPYLLSPGQEAERVAEAREARIARRERLESEAFEKGTISDGALLDAVEDRAEHIMRDGGGLDKAARRYFEDPDANIGSLIAGAGEIIRHDRTTPGQADRYEPMPDTPPLTLRMPK